MHIVNLQGSAVSQMYLTLEFFFYSGASHGPRVLLGTLWEMLGYRIF